MSRCTTRPAAVDADGAGRPGRAALLEVGALLPRSTRDWPGRHCAVVYVQGCAWRCVYCRDPQLQPRRRRPDAPAWPDVLARLASGQDRLDGVVFSGGEPTIDVALPAALAQTRALGLAVGLHSAGIYPARLRQVLPLLDWVALDLKADVAGYEAVTGVRGSAVPALRSLQLVAASGIDHEVRTTYDPDLLGVDALAWMAHRLSQCGCRRWVLQRRRTRPASGPSWRATVPPPCLPHLGELGRSLGMAIALR